MLAKWYLFTKIFPVQAKLLCTLTPFVKVSWEDSEDQRDVVRDTCKHHDMLAVAIALSKKLSLAQESYVFC